MEIIPAIDIISGKCVRLTKGNFKSKKIYSSNPLKIAQLFQKAGIKRLHLIDLEGAREGKIKNWQTIKKIAKNTNLLIEFGGGIRDEREIKKLLNLGIDKVILGSSALKDPEKFKRIVKEFPDKIIVAVDILGKKICYRGWQKEAKKELSSFLEDLLKLGIKTILCTDIGRDGTLKGPNFSLYKKLVRKFPNLEIIASGGVRNKEDLKKLSKIGVAGAIVGKAIYENKISLNDLKSMTEKKIIPCLDCKIWKGKWSVVKGIKFEKLRFAGDPVKLAKKYSDEGADELAMLDISASLENRKPFFTLVKGVAKVIKIPLTVGGGIATLSDIEKLLKAGASKVSLNTAVVKNPNFLNQAVKKFGSERIVVAIDAERQGKSWKVCILGGTKVTNLDAIKWAKEVKRRGAGELLPTSKDRDGTKKGYDLELLRELKKATNLPIIASGGAGKEEHFLEVFQKAKANAALAASLFHFGKIKIPELKKYLKGKGINVNL